MHSFNKKKKNICIHFGLCVAQAQFVYWKSCEYLVHYEKRLLFFPIRHRTQNETKKLLHRHKMDCSFQYFNVHRGQKYVNIWLALNIIASEMVKRFRVIQKCKSKWHFDGQRLHSRISNQSITKRTTQHPMAMRKSKRQRERERECGHTFLVAELNGKCILLFRLKLYARK